MGMKSWNDDTSRHPAPLFRGIPNRSPLLTTPCRSAIVRLCRETEEPPEDQTKDEVSIELNTDFSTKGLSSQEIQGIVAAQGTGAIGRENCSGVAKSCRKGGRMRRN